jgi:hypothetical protein
VGATVVAVGLLLAGGDFARPPTNWSQATSTMSPDAAITRDHVRFLPCSRVARAVFMSRFSGLSPPPSTMIRRRENALFKLV